MTEFRATGRLLAVTRKVAEADGGRKLCTFQMLDVTMWRMRDGQWSKERDLKEPLPCVAYDADADWILGVGDGVYLAATGFAVDCSSIGEDYRRQRDKWFVIKVVEEQGSRAADGLAKLPGIKAALGVLALTRAQRAKAMAYLFDVGEEGAARLLSEAEAARLSTGKEGA